MVGTARPSTRSVGLVELVGCLPDILGAVARLNTPSEAPKLPRLVNFDVFASTLDGFVALASTQAAGKVDGGLGPTTDDSLGHIVGISDHIRLVIGVEVLWN